MIDKIINQRQLINKNNIYVFKENNNINIPNYPLGYINILKTICIGHKWGGMVM